MSGSENDGFTARSTGASPAAASRSREDGIEECAKWHDEQFNRCAERAKEYADCGDIVSNGHQADEAQFHMHCAVSLRMLRSRLQPAAAAEARRVDCWRCGGCGELDASATPCPACNGKGYHAAAAEAPSSAERVIDILEDAGVPEEWRTHYANLLAEVLTPALAAENERLRDALKPFAEVAVQFDYEDDTVIGLATGGNHIIYSTLMADYRRAHTVRNGEGDAALRSLTPREGG